MQLTVTGKAISPSVLCISVYPSNTAKLAFISQAIQFNLKYKAKSEIEFIRKNIKQTELLFFFSLGKLLKCLS